ncbi:MAG: C25 family cysteine peptidase, partial [Candidatus Thorarchaeota archaeon]
NRSMPIPTTIFGEVYTTNISYPGEIAKSAGGLNTSAMFMRGRRLMEVYFYPIQYNPVTSNLTIYSQIIVKAKYSNPAQIKQVDSSLASYEFESIFQELILNYYIGPPLIYPGGWILLYPPVDGAEYLIITTSEFEYDALRLAAWKTQKGRLAKVELVTETVTVENILHRVYESWNPVPTFAVILGDCESIPTKYVTLHPSINEYTDYPLYGERGYIGSDLHYFTLDDENDYLPEMIYSRISVDTPEQARIIVDKILAYEKDPNMIDAEFYNTVLSTAYFDDNERVWDSINGVWKGEVDGIGKREDLAFVYQAEKVREYLLQWYDVNRSYVAYTDLARGGHIPEWHWQVPYPNGIPTEPVVNIDPSEWISAYMSDSQLAEDSIVQNIDEGRFLVYHIDHGYTQNQVWMGLNAFDEEYEEYRDPYDGWQFPYFELASTNLLNNEDRLPLVIDIACSTGWFDGENDSDVMGELYALCSNESLAENLTRCDNGAIAVIAASRIINSAVGRDMLNGIIQAFWPGFLTYQNRPIYEMGTALLFGKLHAYKTHKDVINSSPLGAVVAQTMFEAFHLFGDPETQLWTDMPSELNVTYPKSLGITHPQRFVVTVKNLTSREPVPFAKVCVQQEGAIYQVGYTDSEGQAIFDVEPASPLIHGNITVTVTRHNFKPFIIWIPVFDTEASITLSQYSGKEGDPIDYYLYGFQPGIDVEIYFNDTHFDTFSGGSGSGNGQAPVPSNLDGYVNVWAVQRTISPFPEDWYPVTTERFLCLTAEDGPDPFFYSYLDPSTWDSSSEYCVWDNPDITVADTMQFNDNDIKVTVRNRADIAATETDVTLWYAPYGGGLSWKIYQTKSVDVPANGQLDVGFSWSSVLPEVACLKVVLFHSQEALENRFDNIGQENVDIIPLTSPGYYEFKVGNPNDVSDYVEIRVRQNGEYSDVWNASILGYSFQMTEGKDNQTIKIRIDPETELAIGEWRLYSMYVYVNGTLEGGMTFNVTYMGPSPIPWEFVLLNAGGAAVIIALVIIVKRNQ